MWLYDRETRVVLDVNGAALAHYGCNREVFLRKDAASLMQAAPCARDDEPDGALLANDDVEFEMVSYPVDFDGRPAVLVSARDVTALRRAERALGQAEQDQRRMTAEFEEHVRERTVQLQAAVSE